MRVVWRSHDHRNITIAQLCVVLFIVLFVLQNANPSVIQAHRAVRHDVHAASQRLPGHTVPLLKDAKLLGPTPSNTVLHLFVSLKLRNEAALDVLLAAQHDPTSPLYQHYLTPQTFASQFSPTQDEVNTAVAYLHQQHLQVTSITPNHLFIHASATVAATEHAFAVTFNDYQLHGRVVYASTDNPLIPENLTNVVANITGLNNVGLYHPIGMQRRHPSARHQYGPGGGFTPEQLRTAYDVQPLLKAGADGGGQTIGLFELSGYRPSDIATYLQYYKLGSPRYSNVLIDGASATPDPDGPEVDTLEVNLDMETASALAPGANQKIYIGPNTPDGVADIYNKIVTDDIAKVVSISWGDCESAFSSAHLDGLDAIFKQGTAQGQAFFAASGDYGAYDCQDTNLAVDFPASDPYVVGVGGTSLQTAADGTYASESAWQGTIGGGGGGGGGQSGHFLRPNYQSSINLSGPYRLVPDVSAAADPATGFSVCCSAGPNPGWLSVGGTSGAAPLWAGIATDINQFLLAGHQGGIGSALPALYQLYTTPQIYTPYHDITTGSNHYYQATPGYDQATGIGTPDAWNIARDLQGAAGLPTQLVANPGFEDGPTGWQEKSSGGYELINTTNPYTGKYSAYLCGYMNCDDAISQAVVIPPSAQKVTLSYWLYIGRGDLTPNCQDNIQISLRTTKGAPIMQVQKLCNTDANGWVQYTFDISHALTAYRGQIVQVVFEAKDVNTPKANFFVAVDDVSLLSLGSTPGITEQLLKNPSFDQDRVPWQEMSSGGYEIISAALVHPGSGSTQSAYLCGYLRCHDSIFQQVVLPATTQKVALSYWVYIARGDPTANCQDNFTATLQTAKGVPIATVQHLCNTDANGWTQYTFDLTTALAAYHGQAIQIVFNASGGSSPRVSFFTVVDDTALLVTHT